MINCRTFIVVVELCAIVYLRVLGRKLDAGQCVTLRGAAFTLPRWKAVQTPRCLRLVRACLSSEGDPLISLHFVFCDFAKLKGNCWYNNWSCLFISLFMFCSKLLQIWFDRFLFMLNKTHFPLKSDLTHFGNKHTIVGSCWLSCQALVRVVLASMDYFCREVSCNDSVTICRVRTRVQRSACMTDKRVDLWGFWEGV